MIGRKGKKQIQPQRSAWDLGRKVEKARLRKMEKKGAKPRKQPVSPYVKGADPAKESVSRLAKNHYGMAPPLGGLTGITFTTYDYPTIDMDRSGVTYKVFVRRPPGDSNEDPVCPPSGVSPLDHMFPQFTKIEGFGDLDIAIDTSDDDGDEDEDGTASHKGHSV